VQHVHKCSPSIANDQIPTGRSRLKSRKNGSLHNKYHKSKMDITGRGRVGGVS
jgi:hypothetical protein